MKPDMLSCKCGKLEAWQPIAPCVVCPECGSTVAKPGEPAAPVVNHVLVYKTHRPASGRKDKALGPHYQCVRCMHTFDVKTVRKGTAKT